MTDNYLPDKANVGGVILKRMPEGRTPEHYLWKRVLEKEWAGTFTLARLTGYKYRIGLDPAFVVEQPQDRKGQLHWYEWILCANGGIITLYDEREMVFTLLTTAQTAAKVLGEVGELALAFDERLAKGGPVPPGCPGPGLRAGRGQAHEAGERGAESFDAGAGLENGVWLPCKRAGGPGLNGRLGAKTGRSWRGPIGRPGEAKWQMNN